MLASSQKKLKNKFSLKFRYHFTHIWFCFVSHFTMSQLTAVLVIPFLHIFHWKFKLFVKKNTYRQQKCVKIVLKTDLLHSDFVQVYAEP